MTEKNIFVNDCKLFTRIFITYYCDGAGSDKPALFSQSFLLAGSECPDGGLYPPPLSEESHATSRKAEIKGTVVNNAVTLFLFIFISLISRHLITYSYEKDKRF